MDTVLLYLALVLALGSIAQWLAWRLRLPAILLLLIFGFAAGAVYDTTSLIPETLLFPAVSLAVAVILFEGGLSLRLGELKEGGPVILRLVTVGALLTWLLAGLAAWWILGLEPMMAALVGAILTVTGPTVIGPLLQHVRPVKRVGTIAKWEGIVIDPVGATLAVLVFEAIQGATVGDTVGRLLLTAGGGLAMGLVVAGLVIWLLKHHWIPDFLESVILLAFVVGAYATSARLMTESAGLIAVTVFGMALANQRWVTVQHLIEFKEILRVLLISTLFILLASLRELDDLVGLGWPALAFLLALLAIRLIAVFGACVGSKLTLREQLFLAWMAPRGIVAAAIASLFALEMKSEHLAEHLPAAITADAARLVPITFLVIVGTVVVYGLTAAPLARRLKLADPDPQGVLFVGAEPLARAMALMLGAEGYQVFMVDTNHRNISAARMAGLPCLCGGILSEYVHEMLDLGGIGRLLAMTSSSEVNTLATREFDHIFGRAGVYQFPPPPVASKRQEEISQHLRARPLFDPKATYLSLEERFAEGAIVKKTAITDEFTYDDFRALYGNTAMPLFLIEPSGALTVCTADKKPAPQSGQAVIALVDPPGQEA